VCWCVYVGEVLPLGVQYLVFVVERGGSVDIGSAKGVWLVVASSVRMFVFNKKC
jgi:hypothetical protein